MAGKRIRRVRSNNPGKGARPSERRKAGSVLPESRSARRCLSLTRSGGHKDPTSWHQNAATVLHCQRSPASRRLASGEDKATAVEGLQTGIILRRGYIQETSCHSAADGISGSQVIHRFDGLQPAATDCLRYGPLQILLRLKVPAGQRPLDLLSRVSRLGWAAACTGAGMPDGCPR